MNPGTMNRFSLRRTLADLAEFSDWPILDDMTLDEMNAWLRCIQPLVFWTENNEPFFGGTCFRVSFAGRFFIMTARHCITNAVQPLTGVWIQAGMDPIPTADYWSFVSRFPDDNLVGDVAIVEADRQRATPDELRRFIALDIQKNCWSRDLAVGQELFVEGFPSRLNDWDLERKRWERGSEKLTAFYEGPCISRGLGILRFANKSATKDLDGFSGAPVFVMERLVNGGFELSFAGMQTRESRFIVAGVIFEALNHAINTPGQVMAALSPTYSTRPISG